MGRQGMLVFDGETGHTPQITLADAWGEARRSYREVFAIGEFRALCSAQMLSCADGQLAQAAIAILVYGRTHSAYVTALVYAVTYLPPVAGGPLLSGLADLPRRRVMIVCGLSRGPADPGAARRGEIGRRTAPGPLRAPLADEALGDGAAVTAFLRDHDPGAQVEQDAGPSEDREQGERQAHQGRVDAEVGG
jgi:hypothetical protein